MSFPPAPPNWDESVASLAAVLPANGQRVEVRRISGPPVVGAFDGLNAGTLVTFLVVVDGEGDRHLIPWHNVADFVHPRRRP